MEPDNALRPNLRAGAQPAVGAPALIQNPDDWHSRIFSAESLPAWSRGPEKELLVALSERLCADCEATWGPAWYIHGTYSPMQLHNEAKARLAPFSTAELYASIKEYKLAEDRNRNMLHCTFEMAASEELATRMCQTVKEACQELGVFAVKNLMAQTTLDFLTGMQRFFGAKQPTTLSPNWWRGKLLAVLMYAGMHKKLWGASAEEVTKLAVDAFSGPEVSRDQFHGKLIDRLEAQRRRGSR